MGGRYEPLPAGASRAKDYWRSCAVEPTMCRDKKSPGRRLCASMWVWVWVYAWGGCVLARARVRAFILGTHSVPHPLRFP